MYLKLSKAFFFIILFPIIVFNTAQADNIANYLNQKFNQTEVLKCFKDKPAYSCSGVMVHTFDSEAINFAYEQFPKTINNTMCGQHDRGDDNALWCPSSSGIRIGAVSFSFLRKDITIANQHQDPIWGNSPIGFILEYNDNANNSTDQFDAYCAYPLNAYSNHRLLDHGCGLSYENSDKSNINLNNCRVLVRPFTVDKYFEIYGNPIRFPEKLCAIERKDFDFFIEISRENKIPEYGLINNEIEIKSWPGVKYEDIPIVAFFYVIHSSSGGDPDPKIIAKYAQLYNQSSGRNVPVVGVDMNILRQAKDYDYPKPFFMYNG